MFLETYSRHAAAWGAAIFEGLLTTLQLAAGGFLLALIIGVLVAVARLSRSKLARALAGTYVELLRGIPTLVVLFVIYFGLPEFGIVLDTVPAGILGLGIGAGGYAAEIIRGGLQSIHFGQREAAVASGLRPVQVWHYILLPQGLRLVLAPLCNLLVVVVKDSSLCALITAPELTLVGKDLSSSYFLPLQVYVLVGLAYLAVTMPLDAIGRSLEERLRINRR